MVELVLHRISSHFYSVDEEGVIHDERSIALADCPSSFFTIDPAVMDSRSGLAAGSIYANLVYHTPPNVTGLFAWIGQKSQLSHDDNEEDSGSTMLTIATSNADGHDSYRLPVFCSGCGYRLHVIIGKGGSRSDCNVELLRVPFSHTVVAKSFTARSYATILYDHRTFNASHQQQAAFTDPTICGSGDGAATKNAGFESLAQRTTLLRSCSASKLTACMRLYQSAAACDNDWVGIADDLISIHTYAQFFFMAVRCRKRGVDLSRLSATLRCIASVESDCPLSFSPSHPSGALIPQLASNFKNTLGAMFPALSMVEAQMANFPNAVADFLNQLEILFPSSDVDAAAEQDDWIDKLLEAIANSSERGAIISDDELENFNFNGRKRGGVLIQNWNRALDEMRGDILDSNFPQRYTHFTQFKQLIEKSDRLKTISRQYGGDAPFSLLHSILGKMFSNLDGGDGYWPDSVGHATLRVEPSEVGEGEEFHILLIVVNGMEELKNLRVKVDFGVSGVARAVSEKRRYTLKYRQGPISLSSRGMTGSLDGENRLLPNGAMEVVWTVLPVPDFRLTSAIHQTPNVLLSFEPINGNTVVQRLRSPRFTIQPRRSLRVLAFSFPTLGALAPFTVSISFINPGYRELKSVTVLEVEPQVVSATNGSNMQWSMEDLQLDGVPIERRTNFIINGLAPGDVRILTATITSPQLTYAHDNGKHEATMALIKDLKVSTLVDGEVPSEVEFRKFFIHHTASNSNFTAFIVSEYQSPQPLYWYNKVKRLLIPLVTLQPVEQQLSEQQLNEQNYSKFKTVLAAFRPLANALGGTKQSRPEVVGDGMRPAFGMFRTPIFALHDSGELVGVRELKPVHTTRSSGKAVGAGVGRWIPRDCHWAVADSIGNSSVVSFVDLHSNGTNVRGGRGTLLYEFIFGNADVFRAPYFPHRAYEVRIPSGQHINSGKGLLLGRIEAVSPVDAPLNYTLLSTTDQESSPLQVIPATGEIVYVAPPTGGSEQHCLNLKVHDDDDGRTATVPVRLVPAGYKEDGAGKEASCELYPEWERTHDNVYDGNLSSLITVENGSESQLIVPLGKTNWLGSSTTTTTTTITTTTTTIDSTSAVSTPDSSLTTPSSGGTPLPQFWTLSSTTTTTIKSTPIASTSPYWQLIPEAEEEEEDNQNSSSGGAIVTLPELSNSTQTTISRTGSTTIDKASQTTIDHRSSSSRSSTTRSHVSSLTSSLTSSSPDHSVTTKITEYDSGTIVPGQTGSETGSRTPLFGRTITSMLGTACRRGSQNSIWTLICDLGKTIYEKDALLSY